MEELEYIVTPLLKWYESNARKLPWRENTQAYRVWISEIMLQQTRVETVIPYYKRFMQRFPNVSALAKADEEELMKLWEGLGYYTRARNLQKAAQVVCERFSGQFPSDYEQVLSLPGIGEYTAGAICSIAFGLPVAAVDGNVLRVLTRVCEDSSDIMDVGFRRRVKMDLEKVYPSGHCGTFTQSLMELGAMICVPNGVPKCEDCPLKQQCKAYAGHTQERFPVKKKKAQRRVEEKTVLVLVHHGLVALRRREDKGLLGGMWEIPNMEGIQSEETVLAWLTEQQLSVKSIHPLKNNKHIFTHVEWHMSGYVAECNTKNEKYQWVTKKELLHEYALPTAFKKIYDSIDEGVL